MFLISNSKPQGDFSDIEKTRVSFDGEEARTYFFSSLKQHRIKFSHQSFRSRRTIESKKRKRRQQEQEIKFFAFNPRFMVSMLLRWMWTGAKCERVEKWEQRRRIRKKKNDLGISVMFFFLELLRDSTWSRVMFSRANNKPSFVDNCEDDETISNDEIWIFCYSYVIQWY